MGVKEKYNYRHVESCANCTYFKKMCVEHKWIDYCNLIKIEVEEYGKCRGYIPEGE